MLGTKPSSAFGCLSSTLIVNNSVLMLIDGLHEPWGCVLRVSKQILPSLSIFG
jgi:hypothetical protein